MKSLKNEKGIITMITLITVLFILSFLISSYAIVANKVKIQKDILTETKKIYEPIFTMEEIYNSYFINENLVPIYTVEQLLAIGSDEPININGKIYTFLNDNEIAYVLKNDLEFSTIDLGLETDWIAVGNSESGFNGNFEGNGHTITVTNLDGTEHIYSERNAYGGLCNLTINVIPEDATISLTINEETTNDDSIDVGYNTTVYYSISKEGYIEKTGSMKITENTILEINLEQSETQT